MSGSAQPPNGFYSITGQNLMFTGNRASGGYQGFYEDTGQSNAYSKNTAAGMGDSGFSAYSSNGTLYRQNTANGNGYGFYIDGGDGDGFVTVIGNVANNNDNEGFYTYYAYYSDCSSDSGSTFLNNTANGNGDEGFYDYYSINALWSGNVANNNGEEGFQLEYPQNIDFTGNSASGNASTGVWFQSNEPDGPYNIHLATKNSATKNGDYGFYADYPAPGYANVAKKNLPYDCYNVACQTKAKIPAAGTKVSAPAPRPSRH